MWVVTLIESWSDALYYFIIIRFYSNFPNKHKQSKNIIVDERIIDVEGNKFDFDQSNTNIKRNALDSGIPKSMSNAPQFKLVFRVFQMLFYRSTRNITQTEREFDHFQRNVFQFLFYFVFALRPPFNVYFYFFRQYYVSLLLRIPFCAFFRSSYFLYAKHITTHTHVRHSIWLNLFPTQLNDHNLLFNLSI